MCHTREVLKNNTRNMDGDICRDITQNFRWIAHFHIGGAPGRHQTGRDPIQSLKQAIKIITV